MNLLAAYEITGNTGEQFIFWVCAVVAVAGAVGLLLARKAVHSALWLVSVMISLAVLYFSLQAPFLGVAQVIVYTGAVMMLFLFVLMMVGVDASDSRAETIAGQRVVGVLFGAALLILLVAAVGSALTATPTGLDDANGQYGGNVEGLARLIFGRYLLAFEVTSALLVGAAIGAMVLAFRERRVPRPTQAEVSRQRFLDGGHVTPMPGPGVYARHNAVGAPALLPDGTASDLSVPEPLRGRSLGRADEASDRAQVAELAAGRSVVGGRPAGPPRGTADGVETVDEPGEGDAP